MNEVPGEYHLMTVGAAAADCPPVVNISFSDRPALDQPLPWFAATKMAMPTVCSTPVWYIAPNESSSIHPYTLDDQPVLSTLIQRVKSLEVALLMLTPGAGGIFPLLGWTDGPWKDLPFECREWLRPPWTFWAFFVAGSRPMPLGWLDIPFGTVPAGARGALLSTLGGSLCAYAEAGQTSSTPPPVSRDESDRLGTPLPTASGANNGESLSSAARLWVTIGIGVGSLLVVALVVAAGVTVVRRRLAATAAAPDSSD